MSERSQITAQVMRAARRGDFLGAFQGLEAAQAELPGWEFRQLEIVVSSLSGLYGRALAAIDAGLEELANDPQHMVMHCVNSAWCLLRYGDVCRAEDLVLAGLRLTETHARDLSVARWRGRLLINWGEVAYAMKLYQQAYIRYQEAEAFLLRCEDPFEVANRDCVLPIARMSAGMSALRLGNTVRARELLDNVKGFAPEAQSLEWMARAALALIDGQAERALMLIRQVKKHALDDRVVMVEAQRLELEALQRLGRPAQREQVLAEAFRIGLAEGLDVRLQVSTVSAG